MKILNKIISLTMAVIMLITATPVLQAAEFSTTLDMAELNELREEISSSMPEPRELKTTKNYEGIPSIKKLKQRYAEAEENYKQAIKDFTKNTNEQELENYKLYIEKLKSEAKLKAKTNKEYNGFSSEEERYEANFYTLLLGDMERARQTEDFFFNDRLQRAACVTVCGLLGVALGFVSEFVVSSVSFTWLTIGGGLIGLVLGALLIPPAEMPMIDPNLSADLMKYEFLKNPFRYAALFNKHGYDDFTTFYSQSEGCAQILYDVIDIEYYISRNPNMDNVICSIYTRSNKWKDLDTEKRVVYLHNLAERLRAEAKSN